jgi:hypothetical protein
MKLYCLIINLGMFITDDSKSSMGSFKLGYSRGLPSYLAPKLLFHKKQEEYFIASLYAQLLLYNTIPVIGVDVLEDDSNKGADVAVKILNEKTKTIQVTRFTLTDYLKRRKIAEKKVEYLISQILKIVEINFPVNVTISPLKAKKLPPGNKKFDDLLAAYIGKLITTHKEKLQSSTEFVNCPVTINSLNEFIPFITLQSIPKEFYSNFFGRNNLFINYEFDNVIFTKDDIEKECANIFNKKNNGKAAILLIWADTFEILYNPKEIGICLEKQFKNSSFEEVFFFSFYNRLDKYLDNQIAIAKLK